MKEQGKSNAGKLQYSVVQAPALYPFSRTKSRNEVAGNQMVTVTSVCMSALF
uniref:Uncharacterized protein n=1 Tax=Anguilla anguilla TaxID=7936 RepID=A0A0E9XVF5_ANGAN